MTSLQVLSRIRAGRPEPSPYGRCELCAAPTGDQHGHVVGVATRALRCACRPCYLLFTRDDAALSHRAVPDRHVSLGQLPQWADLDLPVGTAFLFVHSGLDRVVALYPGPAGATESDLPLDAWSRVVGAVPALATLQPDVEALLVHDGEGFVVPVDVCYELVGRLRVLWRGFDGGTEVRACLDELVDRVRTRG